MRAIKYTMHGALFTARGEGRPTDVVARSVSRRVTHNGSVTLIAAAERGVYEAQWYDPETETYQTAEVRIEGEV